MTHADRPRDPRAEPERDDVLEVLHGAFAAVPVPEATPTLAGSDATTRRSVAWMAAAWAALPVPATPATPVTWQRPAAQRFPARRIPWLRHAAAAAVLVSLATLLRFGVLAPGHVPGAIAEPPVLVDTTDTTDSQGDALDTVPRTGLRRAPQRALVAVANDHLEMRSGPVRLVLVTSEPQPAAPPAFR